MLVSAMSRMRRGFTPGCSSLPGLRLRPGVGSELSSCLSVMVSASVLLVGSWAVPRTWGVPGVYLGTRGGGCTYVRLAGVADGLDGGDGAGHDVALGGVEAEPGGALRVAADDGSVEVLVGVEVEARAPHGVPDGVDQDVRDLVGVDCDTHCCSSVSMAVPGTPGTVRVRQARSASWDLAFPHLSRFRTSRTEVGGGSSASRRSASWSTRSSAMSSGWGAVMRHRPTSGRSCVRTNRPARCLPLSAGGQWARTAPGRSFSMSRPQAPPRPGAKMFLRVTR